MTRIIQVAAAVVTFAATVIGAIAAVQSRPERYRLADWVNNANSVCEQDFHAVYQPMFATIPMLAQTMAAMQTGAWDDAKITQIAGQLLDLSGAFRKVAGDLRAIRVPKGKGTGPIAELVKVGDDISTELGAAATALTKQVTGNATQADGVVATNAIQLWSTVSGPAWLRLSKQLGAGQCELFGAAAPTSPAAGTPPTSPSPPPNWSPPSPATAAASQPPASPFQGPDEWTPAELALLNRIRSTILVRCAADRGSENGDVVAAITCATVASGPIKRPLVLQFGSAAAMGRFVTQWAAGVDPPDRPSCAAGPYNDQWTSSVTGNERVGQLICRPISTDDFKIAWSFDRAGIVVLADGADSASLYHWWTANAYLIVD